MNKSSTQQYYLADIYFFSILVLNVLKLRTSVHCIKCDFLYNALQKYDYRIRGILSYSFYFEIHGMFCDFNFFGFVDPKLTLPSRNRGD